MTINIKPASKNESNVVFFDDFNEIEKFILEMPKRNLIIIYLE